ncbi:trigger factor protein (TF) C-terminus [Eubacterium uniforme]|uniref:Trigger factor protein (TF) C-terminus n=1 Tax=Eubacterium uniforme TaxID=39495 RepID=A0A1T4W0A5_9FIRM|nr:hypothetical protein [Eubacterium uniforme]SKA70692.1 trigger factor protein (TF) C-terminus [Eubacterium uniforme]
MLVVVLNNHVLGRKMRYRRKSIIIMGVIFFIGLLLLLCKDKKVNKYQSVLDAQGYSKCKITKLGSYKKIKKSKVKISKEDIEEYKLLELEKFGKFENSNELIVRNGCYVDADIKQIVEGKVIDEDKGYVIKIGLGKFDENIEKKLIGHKVNEELNYVIGDIKYCIIINRIKKYILPDIDDEFIKKNYRNEGLESVKEFDKWIYDNCYENEKNELKNRNENMIIDEIMNNSQFEISDDVVAKNALDIYHKYLEVAYAYGYDSIEDYCVYELNEEKETFYEECCDEAKNEIKECLIICEIADKQGIKVSEDEINKYAKKNKINFKEDDTKNQIVYMIIREKVMNYLIND